MFDKLFKKIDEFIEKINEITNLEQIAIEILQLINEAFNINVSNDSALNEKTFDDIMQKEGLWKNIGKKLKKSLKSKEEFLKQLLYIYIIMTEFEKRYKEHQKTNNKDKETKKIIEKYTKKIKEILENIELSKEYKNEEIRRIRAVMEKEIKALDMELSH